MGMDAPLRFVPPWCRALGGVVAAAAVVALALLIGNPPARDPGVVGVVGLVAHAVLYLCVATLAGYTAATGFPPTHLWPLAAHSCWPMQAELLLTPDLRRYALRLHARYPEVRECWLLDSGRRDEWWLLVFAGSGVLARLRDDWQIRRKDVHLHLGDDESGVVALAWGRSVPRDFAAWDWENDTDVRAEFRCPVTGTTRLACRLWQRP